MPPITPAEAVAAAKLLYELADRLSNGRLSQELREAYFAALRLADDRLDDLLRISRRLTAEVDRLLVANELALIDAAAAKNPALVKLAGEQVAGTHPESAPSFLKRAASRIGLVLVLAAGLSVGLSGCCSGPRVHARPETATLLPHYGVVWPEDASRNPDDYVTVEQDGRMVTTTPKMNGISN